MDGIESMLTRDIGGFVLGMKSVVGLVELFGIKDLLESFDEKSSLNLVVGESMFK